MQTSNHWDDYINHGFALTPLRQGTKEPVRKDWPSLANAITSVDGAQQLNGSAGLLLAHCTTPLMTLDIDDLAYALGWFDDHGIDLTKLMMSGVQIDSGKANHSKLVFKLDKPMVHTVVKNGSATAIENPIKMKK